MISREEAKKIANVAKYGMSYDMEGNKGFTGHENMIDRIYDSIGSCSECKHTILNETPAGNFIMCVKFEHTMNSSMYCGLFERKQDDNN